ncbi:DNA phosphorothioation system sulfurtransferase DndC [Hymenobacter sp. J193]|uniref:DNA phosphorothioation system sulfurtransferase DndC n=1 Tax=Hymenobacter sp. J193 TaxID=2898429 RepID=UPI002151CBE2|nr:DNA phosphorothioation system sulfurtransferase DndC [Hymenobacter sp. J193]MCR5890354.1 DNA phosphorothioation system sulfurtransferase DndC [Hymenobacter sp. J193]
MPLDISFIEAELQDQYLIDDNNRPWILGFSGGKDSTLLLQLAWRSIAKLPEELRHRPVYIVTNDTRVENPRVAKFVEQQLRCIEAAAQAAGLPFIVQRTLPELQETFWAKLIGLGYPAPDTRFRWCTDRLKISPTTRFIQSKISSAGEVIILLGTREAESSKRAQSMRKHAVRGQRLRKHVLPNAAVFAPIRDVLTPELWQYLSQVSPPWGGSHKELITLYRNASVDEDCPLVIDTETASCGKSRFGCWVCTVVARDKSMEGLIQNGEDWMEPLAELRNFLIEARDNPATYRQKELRRGYVREEAWGPYSANTRAEVLRRLLQAQYTIQQEVDASMSFISYQELITIQALWHRDGLFEHSVASIYNSIYPVAMRDEGLLREVCTDNPDHFDLITQAMEVLKTQKLLGRRRNHVTGVEAVLDKYLRNQK